MTTNPTVEEMMRIVTLGRYLMWCQMQRDHYKEIKVDASMSLFDSMEVQRAFMYVSYWYGLSP
jgi:hypothetical protein